MAITLHESLRSVFYAPFCAALASMRTSMRAWRSVHGYIDEMCTGTFGQAFDGPHFTSGNIVTLCNAEGC